MFYCVRDGTYYYEYPGTDLGPIGSDVAVAFDALSWSVLMHGATVKVIEWARKEKRRLGSSGAHIMVIKGKIPVQELNNIITVHGYIQEFVGQKS